MMVAVSDSEGALLNKTNKESAFPSHYLNFLGPTNP